MRLLAGGLGGHEGWRLGSPFTRGPQVGCLDLAAGEGGSSGRPEDRVQ